MFMYANMVNETMYAGLNEENQQWWWTTKQERQHKEKQQVPKV